MLAVPDREHRGSEPVGSDDAEVPDGRGTVENIHDQPRVTDHTAKHPPAQALVGGRQGKYGNGGGNWGQYGNGEQEVAERQVADEKVGDGSKPWEPDQCESY